MKKIKLLNFTYNPEELKNAAIDSLLVESSGKANEIARLELEVDGQKENISLNVCGEVRIIYKHEIYRYPCDFPDELIEIIKQGKAYDGDNENLIMSENNWIEIWHTKNGEIEDDDGFVDGEFGDGSPKYTYEYLNSYIKEFYSPNDDMLISGEDNIHY